MKKLHTILSLILAVFLLFSCNVEELEGEFFSTPDGSDPEEFCANAVATIAGAQLALATADPADQAMFCEALRNAINGIINQCGDPGGSFQMLLDELGTDCMVMTDDGGDDGGGDVTCESVIDQEAQGSFRGVDFVNQGGSYRLQSGSYFCRILVTELIGGDCFFPEFGGNEGSILFGLSNLEPQVITLSDVVGEGESLNFNTIEDGVTIVELAVCGELEILSSTETTVTGRVTAIGQQGSTINGNFTLTLCE